MEQRIRHQGLRRLVCSPREASLLIRDGDVVGISGFTRAGDAKVVLLALADRVREEGRPIRIDLQQALSWHQRYLETGTMLPA